MDTSVEQLQDTWWSLLNCDSVCYYIANLQWVAYRIVTTQFIVVFISLLVYALVHGRHIWLF